MPNFNSTKNQINLRANTYHRKDIPAVALLAALIGISQVSYANSLPLGNTAGSNNIAVGTDSFASGSGSQAVGNNAIATGGNITPEEFKAELENFRELLNNIEGLRTQIAEQEKQGTVNQQLQDALNSQIAQYESILERVRDKLAQQAELTNQKTTKQGELDSETNRLKEMENGFGSNAFIPGGTKESYRNFLNIINALDWNKLNTPTGIADLTTDLKNGVEKDFGTLNISDVEYQALIEGYRNAQGNITFLKPILTQKLNTDFAKLTTQDNRIVIIRDQLNPYRSSPYNDANIDTIMGSLRSDIYIKDSKDFSLETLMNHILYDKPLEIEEKYTVPRPVLPIHAPPRSKEWSDYNIALNKWTQEERAFRKAKGYLSNDQYRSVKPHIMRYVVNNLYANTDGALYKTTQHYKGDIFNYINNRYDRNSTYYDLNSNLILPPVKRQLQEDEYIHIGQIKNAISYISNIESTLTLDQLLGLEAIVSNFKKYNDLIDYNNNDSWMFDKDEFKSYIDSNVLPFMNKMEELATNLRSLESSTLSEDERNAKAAKVIELRSYIKEYRDYIGSKATEKYYISHFEPTKWNIDIKGEISKAIKLWKQYEAEAQATLLPYNNDSLALREINKAIDAKSEEINTQKETIKTKQTEIADLENQINALALTGEEQSAESIKNDLTVKLDEAKAKLAEITQVLTEKRNELLGLNNQLDTSPLGSKGKNAIAEGNNAFASGENAIATGADSLATGNNAIALGANAKATAESAIAIGKGAQALKAKALALGENAIANGVSAIAIGYDTGVSGEKAVGIGSSSLVSGDGAVSIGSDNIVAHKNAVAIGSKITQTAENSVNLGNESAATVERTAETAGTTKYEHSDLLGEVYKFAASQAVGVVTVGAKGKERRVQNVAAGLVSETSTDAVNGSQLYAVAKAVDEGKLGVVKYNSTSGVVGVANHLGGNEVNISNASGETRRLAGVSEGVAPTDAVNKAQLDREIGAVHNRIGGVENRVNHVEKEVKKVKGAISNAVAMASLPQASAPGQRQLSVATGHTLGTTSVAVGLNGLSDNGRISYKLNTSVSQKSDFAVGAGVGFTW